MSFYPNLLKQNNKKSLATLITLIATSTLITTLDKLTLNKLTLKKQCNFNNNFINNLTLTKNNFNNNFNNKLDNKL